MKIYKFPQDNQYGDVFAIATIGDKAYVCPGWHEVPKGTTRDQITFEKSTKIKPKKEVVKTKIKTWNVESSKPGKFYKVTEQNGEWDCNCPAKSFFRGDCKHIKKMKEFKTFQKNFSSVNKIEKTHIIKK
jgi:hypothetical protein